MRDIQIIENKALLITTDTPQNIITTIPESNLLNTKDGVNTVLVRWSLDNVRVLRNLGHNAPTPILGQYAWPGIFSPRSYQKITADFMAAHPRMFCLNEQGTGKTAAGIWAADYLMTQKEIKRALIVCPLSVMSVWLNEIFSVAMHRTVHIAHGTKQERIRAIRSGADFVIINVDGVVLMAEELLKAKFDLIIIDEFTNVKNSTTNRWRAANTLMTPHTRGWLFSGTPTPQGPLDAYGPVKLICPQNVPKFYSRWRDEVMVKINQFKWVPRANAMERVFEVMQPAIRFEKQQCLDLPRLTYQTIDVDMSPQQQKYYNDMKRHLQITAQGVPVTAVNAAALMTKLLQIALGAVNTDIPENSMQFDISTRLEATRDIIDGASGKVLIAVPYINALKNLYEVLQKHYSCALVYGAVSAKQRATIFHQFQKEADPKVLLVQPRTTAHGITLVEADTIIWFGPVTSFETYEQFNARIDRIGQVRKPTVYMLQSCDTEKKLNNTIRHLKEGHVTITEMFRDIITNPT